MAEMGAEERMARLFARAHLAQDALEPAKAIIRQAEAAARREALEEASQ